MTPVKPVNGLFSLARLAAMALTLTSTLAACGGGGGSSPPAAPTVSISLTPASVVLGQVSTLTWSSTNASACTASGAWAGAQSVSGSISASQPTAGTYTYSMSCSGPSGSATGSATLAVSAVNNVATVVIDSGPAGGSHLINVPYVSVTVCRPGTATCQTIDHILVDTGSFGLRIIAPGVLDPSLALPSVTNAAGDPVGECAKFVSGFTWGSVRSADVKLGGETALSIPVEEIGDTSPIFSSIPSNCSSSGANIGTVAALGAKGILGVGLFNQDCGSYCVNNAASGFYYGCTATTCTGTTLPLASQVANPVSAFSVDNNGVLLSIPSVPDGGSTTVTGALIFGIGTQANNQIGSAVKYTVNSAGDFTTTYKGATLTSSFLDSGSNGFYFPDNSIAACTHSPSYFCPPQATALTASNVSANGSASGTVAFTIDNFETLGSTITAAPVGGNTANVPGINGFDWGLPFFFGRPVFVAIAGMNTPAGVGPFWIY